MDTTTSQHLDDEAVRPLERRALHVLFLSPLLAVGGEEVSTLTLSRELLARGHRVSLLATRGPLWPEFEREGVTLIDAGPYRRTPAGLRGQMTLIRRALAERVVDVIHSQSIVPTLAAAWAVRSARASTVPIIHHHRGLRPSRYPVVARLFNHVGTRVIANSDYERALLVRHGLRPARCVRIHNCANLDLASMTPGPRGLRGHYGLATEAAVVGTVGRLTEDKDLPSLLTAFAEIRRECPRAVLVIVGDGHLRGPLEARARRLGLADHVVFAGARRDLHDVYPAFDVFVLASRIESFGNVALEAALFGKPVVGTRVGGLPETVIDGETGLLVPPGDPPALARAVRRLLDDPLRAAAMGAAGRRRALAYFTPGRVGDEVERLYRAVLAG